MPTENKPAEPFKREDRYIVIKRSDLKKVPVSYRSSLVDPMFSLLSHLPRRECLVIESDWPEYESYWQMIERRMTGQPAVTAAEELEAVLHWRNKHAQAIKERDALQERLNAADQRIDELTSQLDELCEHEWTDDGDWNVICSKCGKVENHEPHGWVQTRGDAINHFTQEWDVVQEWEDKGFEYKAMYDRPDLSGTDEPDEYGPTPGCKQCEEAEACGFTDCPECYAQLHEDVNGTGFQPGREPN